MKKIKLLSYDVNENTPTYGDKNKFISKSLSNIKSGDTANSSKWIFQTNHIGTHIDFPRHFCKNGKTVSDYEPDFWIFNKIGFIECDVVDFKNEIGKIPSDIEILIWKSGFGKFRNKDLYWEKQPVIPSNFADMINERFQSIRVFGFDMISLTSQLDKTQGKLIHNKFLCNYEILIVEDMDLSFSNFNFKKIIISPWQIKGADGAPCSVLGFID
ncbi:cyclase family protein [Flavobacteriaceae bacterium]|nr:cyclase family protein [Flavobacteriaceae bacterium]